MCGRQGERSRDPRPRVIEPSVERLLGGPWNLTGAMVYIAGMCAALTPAALAMWGLGCTLTIAASVPDQSNESGFAS